METKALSRDDIIKLLFEKDFFANNQALIPIADKINKCKIAYVKSAYGHCCGGNIGLMFPAIDALFEKLSALKKEDQAAIDTFCRYLGHKKGYDKAEFTVYYRKTNEGKPIKLSLP
jgi:hypothetical protein